MQFEHPRGLIISMVLSMNGAFLAKRLGLGVSYKVVGPPSSMVISHRGKREALDIAPTAAEEIPGLIC